jgi:hypothetical protein
VGAVHDQVYVVVPVAQHGYPYSDRNGWYRGYVDVGGRDHTSAPGLLPHTTPQSSAKRYEERYEIRQLGRRVHAKCIFCRTCC